MIFRGSTLKSWGVAPLHGNSKTCNVMKTAHATNCTDLAICTLAAEQGLVVHSVPQAHEAVE